MKRSHHIPNHALIWILLSVTLAILPQVNNLPYDLLLLAGACVLWRLLIHMEVLKFPRKPAKLIAFLIIAISLAYQIQRFGPGLESAASLLTMGFAFKLIEMRYRRDVYIVLSLCFMLVMVALLYSQSAIMTIYLLVCIWAVLTAMVSVNRSARQASPRLAYPLAGKILLQAFPLTIVLFVVFPRIAPLWAVPIPSEGATTGVTDEMSPGDLSQLGRSSDLAFRVKFENTPPPLHSDLYWRGLVLEDFDGETWRRSRSRSAYGAAAQRVDFRFQWEDRVQISGQPLSYNVILEPTQQPWIYALHLAEPVNSNLLRSRNFEVFNSSLVSSRLSYDMRSYPANRTDVVLLDSVRRRALQLPDDGNSRARELAEELRSSTINDRDFVYAVLAFFQENPFYYTLNPSLLGEDRIDDFLFGTQEGFCEHYASAFAYLMRAAGIPARVVVGYQGAEYNRYEDFLQIFQYNAHAWNEVWLEGEGWVRVDPTAAVAPERVETGVEAALANDPAFREQSLLMSVGLGGIDWINTLRMRLEAFEYEWNRLVVNYEVGAQFDFFQDNLGSSENGTRQKLFLGMSLLLLTVLFVWALSRKRVTVKGGILDSAYLALSEELSHYQLARRMGEGPADFQDRVVAQLPEISDLMNQFTEIYISAIYGAVQLSEAEEKQGLTQLRQLLKEIKQCLRHIQPVKSAQFTLFKMP